MRRGPPLKSAFARGLKGNRPPGIAAKKVCRLGVPAQTHEPLWIDARPN
jgi:hypothetical protein